MFPVVAEDGSLSGTAAVAEGGPVDLVVVENE
jgi:hypothetical protein